MYPRNILKTYIEREEIKKKYEFFITFLREFSIISVLHQSLYHYNILKKFFNSASFIFLIKSTDKPISGETDFYIPINQ